MRTRMIARLRSLSPVWGLPVLVGLALLVGLAAESCGHSSARRDDAAAPPSPTALPDLQDLAASAALYRLTPEQVSSSVAQSLGVTLPAKTASGLPSDQFKVTYNVALGGVDFSPTRQRDASAKVQTVLISRTLAWKVANQLVASEAKLIKAGQAPAVFGKCDLSHDRPMLAGEDGGAAQASEAKWTDQLTELYWRLYGRAPTTGDVAAVKATFVAVYVNEGKSTSKAWMAILYVLMSTAEFWHA